MKEVKSRRPDKHSDKVDGRCQALPSSPNHYVIGPRASEALPPSRAIDLRRRLCGIESHSGQRNRRRRDALPQCRTQVRPDGASIVKEGSNSQDEVPQQATAGKQSGKQRGKQSGETGRRDRAASCVG